LDIEATGGTTGGGSGSAEAGVGSAVTTGATTAVFTGAAAIGFSLGPGATLSVWRPFVTTNKASDRTTIAAISPRTMPVLDFFCGAAGEPLGSVSVPMVRA